MGRQKLDPHDINRVKTQNPASLRSDRPACSGMRVQLGVESLSSFTGIRMQHFPRGNVLHFRFESAMHKSHQNETAGGWTNFLRSVAITITLLAVAAPAHAIVIFQGYDAGAGSLGAAPNSTAAAAAFDAALPGLSIVNFESATPGFSTTGDGVVTNTGGCAAALCGYNTTPALLVPISSMPHLIRHFSSLHRLIRSVHISRAYSVATLRLRFLTDRQNKV